MSERVAVFSGGGAKGAAHVGAMRALEEHGIRPTRFVGTSMGAVIGACFASGLDYDEVLHRITRVSRRDVASLSPAMILGPFARSLLRERPFRETLAALVPARTFDELTFPLTVTAVDATNGDLELFGDGGRARVGLLDALYASCALPLYYPPARIGDREYLDGGLRAVFPLDLALDFEPELVIGVVVGPSRYNPPASRPGPGSEGLIAAHRRSLRIMMSVQIEETIRRWRCERPADWILVQPRVGGTATFAVQKIVQFVEEGYRATVRALQDREPSA